MTVAGCLLSCNKINESAHQSEDQAALVKDCHYLLEIENWRNDQVDVLSLELYNNYYIYYKFTGLPLQSNGQFFFKIPCGAILPESIILTETGKQTFETGSLKTVTQEDYDAAYARASSRDFIVK